MPAVFHADPPGFLPSVQPISVDYDPRLVARYPEVLPATGGQFVTTMEHEGKVAGPMGRRFDATSGGWVGDDQDVVKFVQTAYARFHSLSTDPELAASVLGPGWSIEEVNKFYQKDAQGNVKRGTDGMPVVNPMVDTYQDVPGLLLARKEIVARNRRAKGDLSNGFNVKPGPGVSGRFFMSTRMETDSQIKVGLEKKPGALTALFQSAELVNPWRFVKPLVPNVDPSQLRNSLRLSDNRYKFEMKHINGTRIEISLDDVTATPLTNEGKGKKARFAQIEFENNHPAFSANPTTVLDFSALPANFLANATLGGTPRMHQPSDLSNPGLNETETYKTTDLGALRAGMFSYFGSIPKEVDQQGLDYQGSIPPRGRQKAHVAWAMLGAF